MTNPKKRKNGNARLLETARGLNGTQTAIEAVAELITEAVHHLATELAVAGFPKSGGGERVAGSNSDLTPTEAAAAHTWQLSNARDNLRDGIQIVKLAAGDLDRAVDALRKEGIRALSLGVPPAERSDIGKRHGAMQQCRDHQIGKDGSLDWGDPNCPMPGIPGRGLLCQAHYQKWYRWRNNNDIDTSRDFKEAG